MRHTVRQSVRHTVSAKLTAEAVLGVKARVMAALLHAERFDAAVDTRVVSPAFPL